MTSALTKFGHFCREIRTANNKTMGDQADAMHIDVSLISAIETGGKGIPTDYVKKFGEWLNLGSSDLGNLHKRASAVVLAFPAQKQIVPNSNSIRLFRRISKMDPMQIRKIRKTGPGETAKDDGRFPS